MEKLEQSGCIDSVQREPGKMLLLKCTQVPVLEKKKYGTLNKRLPHDYHVVNTTPQESLSKYVK